MKRAGTLLGFLALATASACLMTETHRPPGPRQADAVAPGAPRITGTTPASPSRETTIRVRGEAEPGSTVLIFANAPCSGTPIASGSAEQFAAEGIVVVVAPNTTTVLYAAASDAAGNVSACSDSPLPHEHDDIPPTFAGVERVWSVASSHVTLTWQPANDGSTPPERIVYEVCQAPAGGSCETFVVALRSTPGATMVNVGGLAPATEYTFAVRARDLAGNVTPVRSSVVARTPGIVGPSGIAVGGAHSCALRADGTARCWGWNVQGQLGASEYAASGGADGTEPADLLDAVRSPTPVPVDGLGGAIALAAGLYHSCALLSDGTARCWGSNGAGQLGDGSANDFSERPVAVRGVAEATALAAGGGHACAVVRDGSVRCWGWNASGQIGDGTTQNRFEAVPVKGLQGVVSVAAGKWHSCALFFDGSVSCWGWGGSGQVGEGTTGARTSPAAVVGVKNAMALSAGGEHTCALLVDGSARCWGANDHGQLGNGEATVASARPVAVKDLSGAIGLAGGASNACAVLGDGTARCWGRNDRGQVGNGGKEPALVASPVARLAGVAGLAAGGLDAAGHGCALLADGSARCWGVNEHGQLGDGTTEDRSLPVAVVSFP